MHINDPHYALIAFDPRERIKRALGARPPSSPPSTPRRRRRRRRAAAGEPARPPVRVRPARPADVPVLTDLAARTFRETYAADTRPEDLEAFLAAHMRADVHAQALARPDHGYVIAEVGGRAVGYAATRPAEPGSDGGRPLLLTFLYVERAFHGKGVGAALMRHCLDAARRRGHDTVRLAVWDRNTRARDFYRRWGFTEAGETTFRLGADLQRDLVMALPL